MLGQFTTHPIIIRIEDTFQGVALPQGDAVVEFAFAPTGVRQAVPIALATLLACLAVLARAAWYSVSKRLSVPPQPATSEP